MDGVIMNKEELKNMYLNQIKDMDIQQSLEHINELIFNIDMIDIWDERDSKCYEVLCEIKRQLQKGEK